MNTIYPNIKVKLTGEDGNAFFIICRVSEAMRKAKISGDVINKFQTEAMSGDYNNLINTCKKYVDIR